MSVYEQNTPVVQRTEEILAEKGISKKFLAGKLGMSCGMMSSVLHGRKLLTANMIQQIADALSVSPEELFTRPKAALPERDRAVNIGGREYQRITVVDESNEVLAVIMNDKVVEKSGIHCILED